jgi:hypothetical protein
MKKMFKPLTLIPKIKGLLLIWIIFILLFGQAGIWATIFTKTNNFFSINLASGNFYTFSIALLSSSVLTFAIEWMNSIEVKFKMFKVISISISFLLITIMMINFSILPTELNKFHVILQISLYLISLFLSIYFLCLEYLHIDYENYKDLDDKSVNNLLTKVQTPIESDDRGIEL